MEDEYFFDDEDIARLAQSHAEKVLTLNEESAKRVIESYKRVRQDLRDRLSGMKPGTFTAQRMRGVLVQVDTALKAMKVSLDDEMGEASEKSARLGVEHLVEELREWDEKFIGAASELNLNLVETATKTSELLINTRKASLDSYSSNLRSRISQGLADGVISQASSYDITERLGNTFLGEEWKLERIVRTELMGIYSRAKLNGMSDLAEGSMPDLMKTVYNPMDARTADDSKYVEKRVEAGDRNLIVPVDEMFRYKYDGKTREYLAPPDRPNDRSILIPYRKAWAKS